ncbi:hypothetical protein Sar04_23580 [Salinispora arenicola]|uniref:Uncharacterized protein n=1 Tax=Salinispora arenicola TaxID=168697 RepID=A0A542XQY1_SALAC|nr:hypothetical protein FB564_3452 [Salinispora arenicola]GIM85622.1 hypothetical protein Sar04_23580 [Salinispora arenicola]
MAAATSVGRSQGLQAAARATRRVLPRVTCQGGGITGIQANNAGGMFVIRGIGTKIPG